MALYVFYGEEDFLRDYNSNKIISTGTKTRTFSIMSERDGTEYYLFIIHNNVKYYVVYYNYYWCYLC